MIFMETTAGNIQPGIQYLFVLAMLKTSWQGGCGYQMLVVDAVLWNGKAEYNNRVGTIKNQPGYYSRFPCLHCSAKQYPPNVNVGDIKNTGIDIKLDSKGNFSKDWILGFDDYLFTL